LTFGVPHSVSENSLFSGHRPRHVRGNPGVLDVFATATMEKLATVETEPGAHTTAIAPAGDWLCAFLPHSHRAAIYEPSGA